MSMPIEQFIVLNDLMFDILGVALVIILFCIFFVFIFDTKIKEKSDKK